MAEEVCVHILPLPTWRMIPVGKWLITMITKFPKDRVGLDPFQLAFLRQPLADWDEPPSTS